jgi:hypothetical protein
MDVHEDVKSNTVTATFELPGLKKEDVNIDVHNNRLTVSGETKTSSEREEGGYAIRERTLGSFSRALQLPAGVKVSSCDMFPLFITDADCFLIAGGGSQGLDGEWGADCHIPQSHA